MTHSRYSIFLILSKSYQGLAQLTVLCKEGVVLLGEGVL